MSEKGKNVRWTEKERCGMSERERERNQSRMREKE